MCMRACVCVDTQRMCTGTRLFTAKASRVVCRAGGGGACVTADCTSSACASQVCVHTVHNQR